MNVYAVCRAHSDPLARIGPELGRVPHAIPWLRRLRASQAQLAGDRCGERDPAPGFHSAGSLPPDEAAVDVNDEAVVVHASASLSVSAGMRTSILPVLAPRIMSRNASTVWSMPSTMVSS